MDFGFQDEKVALVMKNVFSQFRYVYPSSSKSPDQVCEDLIHFFAAEDQVGVIYSDNAPELAAAVKELRVRRNTSREYVDETRDSHGARRNAV